MTLVVIALSWLAAFALLTPYVSSLIKQRRDLIEKRLRQRLEDFHIFVDPRYVRWVVVGVAALSMVIGVVVFRSIWVVPFLLVITVAAILMILRFRFERRLKTIRYQLPGVIELVATSLRAGLSVRSSILQVSRQSPQPVAQELAVLERMQRIGIPLETAMSEWSQRIPLEELKLLTFTIRVSTASGGNLSESLDRMADSFRQRLILEEKVDALTAQGKLQAWVMVALPMLLALVLSWMDADSMRPLWTTTAGHWVLGCVVTLEMLGLLWIRRLIRMPD